MQAFKLSETELESGWRQIDVEGELDLAVADQLQEALDQPPENQQVLINLERCDFIDSTGIAVIVQVHRRMGEAGRTLAVCGANDQVLRVLTLTGLTTNGLAFHTAEDARQASLIGAQEK